MRHRCVCRHVRQRRGHRLAGRAKPKRLVKLDVLAEVDTGRFTKKQ
ncbi:hypothetical protein AB0F11_37465 [Streptomyces sp. NPDC032472]